MIYGPQLNINCIARGTDELGETYNSDGLNNQSWGLILGTVDRDKIHGKL